MSRELDVDAVRSLESAFGLGDVGAQEAQRRGKAERKMTVRADDGRRKKATGRSVQFNVRMKRDIREAIFKAAHKAGVPVTEWIERAALAYLGKARG